MNEFDVLVVGGGLSGTVAAVRAASLGRRVAIATGPPGASALWSGVGDVFGRTSAHSPTQLHTRFERGSTNSHSNDVLDPDKRLERLEGNAPDHPYFLLGASSAELARYVEQAKAALGLQGELSTTPALVPTMGGTVRRADYVSQGIGVLDGKPATFVGLEEWPSWSPEWAAKTATRTVRTEHSHAWAGPNKFLAATALQLAARWHEAGHHRIELLASAATERAIVPAVLGLTFERQHELIAKLGEAGCKVRELAGAADSAFGVRLHRHLAAVLASSDVTAVKSEAIRSEDGQWVMGEASGKAVILATGSQPKADWTRDWYSAHPRPPKNTSDSPWMSQPFLRDGIRVDGALRALCGDGSVFAAGGCLHGHDFVHDGTGFGVALSTGWLAGTQAAEASA